MGIIDRHEKEEYAISTLKNRYSHFRLLKIKLLLNQIRKFI